MIVGAGLAGLIAAHVLPRHLIVDAMPEPRQMHRALLRFRSDAVAQLTGVEFRPVTVRKGVWWDGCFQAPTIAAANHYSRKCLGRIVGDRSIWDLEPVTRYIAPEDFYEQLVEAARPRTTWGQTVNFADPRQTPVVSTAPLPYVLGALEVPAPVEFHRAPITVMRFRAPRCDAHQTVYFPTPKHTLYRASITGDLVIAEFAADGDDASGWLDDLHKALAVHDLEPLESVRQSFGKIAPIPDGERKALVAKLTTEHNIFSLGRFATWRNLLLDDVVHDAHVVKRLINASHYERRLAAL